jgi:hypothetical protein
MSHDRGAGSFDDFVAWLSTKRQEPQREPKVEPSAAVLTGARAAREEFQSLRQQHRQEIAARVRAGRYYEELELLAAADPDQGRWMPRLRTPNGFAISALYGAHAPPGTPPVALLVECPANLIEVLSGQKVYVSIGGRWIEIGEIDADGRATGDLPPGLDFRPPFAFRVGELGEDAAELESPSDPK